MEYAEYLLESTRQVPFKLLDPKNNVNNPKNKSIQQRLLDLYVEECLQRSEDETMPLSLDLLQTLVKRDRLSTVVMNLYPGSEGYSIMLRGKAGTNDTETIKLPYEESEILDYIDNSELPPMFIELFEKAQVNVFYSGCVILELRDYRRSTTGTYDAQYVLLKPTPQTMLADINSITNDGHLWTQDDINQLESQLLLATQGPLCLDPSPSLQYVNNTLQFEQTKFNTPLIKRNAKKYSQAAINRKKKFASAPAPKELSLYEFLHKRRDRTKASSSATLKTNKTCVELLKQKAVHLATPTNVDVDKYASVMDKSKDTADNSLVFVEEYILERERNQIKPHQTKSIYTKVSVYQRPSDEYYFGELYIDHDYVDGFCKGKSCQFGFGSKANVKKYIEQLIEIFTEGGRLYARVSHTEADKSCDQARTSGVSLISPPLHTPDVTPPGQLMVSISPSPTPTPMIVSPISPATTSGPPTPSYNILQATDTQSQVTLQKPSQSYSTKHRHHSAKNSFQMNSNNTSPIAAAPNSGPPSYSPGYHSPQKIMKHAPLPTQSPQPILGLPAQGSLPLNMAAVTMVTTPSPHQRTDNPLYTLMSPPSIVTATVTPPNVNIASLSGLPSNLNIQNLAQLQGLSGLQGLHNVQVSLSGLPVAGGQLVSGQLSSGQLSLPISMISSQQNMLANQGVLVSSLPSGVGGVGSLSGAGINMASVGVNMGPSVVNMGSSVVNMGATGINIGPLSGGAGSLPTTPSPSNLQQTMPPLSMSPQTNDAMATTILTSGSTGSPIFSLPIAMTTGLNQLVPAGMKAAGQHNIRGQTLFQLPGQHNLQLLSVQQQKAQLQALASKPGLISSHPSLPVTSGSVTFSGQPSLHTLTGQSQYNPQTIDQSRMTDNQPARHLSGGHQNLAAQQHLTAQQSLALSQNLTGQTNINISGLNPGLSGLSSNIHGLSGIPNQNISGVNPALAGLGQNVGGITQNISGINPNISGLSQHGLSGLAQNLQSGLPSVGLQQTGLQQSNIQAGLQHGTLQAGLQGATLQQSGLQGPGLQPALQPGLQGSGLQSGLQSNLQQSGLQPQQSGLQTQQLTLGIKPGASNLTHQQLMQFAAVNPQNLTPQQIHTQLALQRQLQLRQGNQGVNVMGLNTAPQQQSVASTSKYKRGKRATPTPPKAN